MFFQSEANDSVINLQRVEYLTCEEIIPGRWVLLATMSDGNKLSLAEADDKKKLQPTKKFILDRMGYKNYVTIEDGAIGTYPAEYN